MARIVPCAKTPGETSWYHSNDHPTGKKVKSNFFFSRSYFVILEVVGMNIQTLLLQPFATICILHFHFNSLRRLNFMLSSFTAFACYANDLRFRHFSLTTLSMCVVSLCCWVDVWQFGRIKREFVSVFRLAYLVALWAVAAFCMYFFYWCFVVNIETSSTELLSLNIGYALAFDTECWRGSLVDERFQCDAAMAHVP